MRRTVAVCTTAMLALGLTLVGAVAPASATRQQIILCHATAADTASNGWVALPPLDSHAIFTPGPSGHDEHSADIIPAFDDYPGKNLDTLYGWGATGAEILANGCALPTQPATEVVPPSASMVDECGTENDSIVVPGNDAGYSFSRSGGDVYLTAADGYAFPDGTVTEWHFTLTDVPCVTPPGDTEVVPPSATMVDECGTENDSIVVPGNGAGYSFSRSGGDVYLTAADGYAFPDGTVTEWHFTLTDVPCVTPPGELIAPAPDFTDALCDVPAVLSLPAFENGSWSWGGKSGASFSGEPANLEIGVPYEVTAVADEGFIIPGQTVWSFTSVEPTDCGGVDASVTVVVPPVTMEDACGPDNEVVTTPEPLEGVTFSQERSGATVTVTATAAQDVSLSYEGELTDTLTWDFAVNDEACAVIPDPPVDPPVVDPPAVDPPAVDPAAVDPAAVESAAVLPAAVTARPLALASTGVEADSMGILALLFLLMGAVVVAIGRKQDSISPSGETRPSSRHAEHRSRGELWAHRTIGAPRTGTVHRH